MASPTLLQVPQQPGVATVQANGLLRIRFSMILLNLLAGCVFILFNFGGFLSYAAHTWFPNSTFTEPVVQVADWPNKLLLMLNGSAPDMLEALLRFCFYGIWVFLAFALFLAIRHQNILIAGNALLGLVAGASSIVVLAWLGMGFVQLSGIVWMVLQFLLGAWTVFATFLGSLLTPIWNFLYPILSFLWPIALALFAVGVVLWTVTALMTRSRWAGVLSIAVVVIFGGLIFLNRESLLPFWGRVVAFLTPIGQFLGSTLGVVWEWFVRVFIFLVGLILIIMLVASGVGIVLLVVGSLGAILVDQFRTAGHSGKGHWEVLFGSFSIGLALALIFWTCSASPELAAIVDRTWDSTMPFLSAVSSSQLGDAFLPQAVRDLSHMALSGVQAPLFDALVLAIVLPISYISLLRNLGTQPKQHTQVTVRYFSRDVLQLGLMLALSFPLLVIVALSAALPHDDA